MAIILRTAYFFNPFCIKQVPINCSKVNPMEQKYFVLANNVFSDGCGGYLTIGTEITLADTIGKNSEDWGLLLHVAGGGEDYWITGTAAEFRTDCECVPDPTLYSSPIGFAASDETTALTTGTSKVTFRMPYGKEITSVRASLTTAQASGSIFTVDILQNGVSILSTLLTIDNTEKTSTTAVTPAVISTTTLIDDAEITVSITQIGNGTATGLKVWII